VSTVFVFFTTFMMPAAVPANIKSVVARFMLYCADGSYGSVAVPFLFFLVLMMLFVTVFVMLFVMLFVTVFVTQFFVFVGFTTKQIRPSKRSAFDRFVVSPALDNCVISRQ
jgi:hypothetical protein